MSKIKLLIVDDSEFFLKLMVKNISQFSDIEIVGYAKDAYDARDKILALKPDIITLDIVMPKMSGLEFINILMKHYPIPIIIISSVVTGNCQKSLQALENGALDILPKPGNSSQQERFFRELHHILKSSSLVKNINRTLPSHTNSQLKITSKKLSLTLISIGASTGGPKAIKSILKCLPENLPPILIAQHMPPVYTTSFAERLNEACEHVRVKEARTGEPVLENHVYIAPGDYHMLVKRDKGKLEIELNQGPKIYRQRPSVDVLFSSLSKIENVHMISILLTGMGQDGAQGLKLLKDKGAKTIIESEASCVVYGMPKEAKKLEAQSYEKNLEDIPAFIVSLINSF